MKINKLLMSLCAAGAIFGLASCQSDDLLTDDNGGNTPGSEYDSGESVYMSITMEMASPSGSRSQTENPNPNPASNDGIEIGSPSENNVSNAIIVLAAPTTNELIAAGIVITSTSANNDDPIGTLKVNSENSYTAIAKITKTNISKWYTQAGNGTKNEDGSYTLNEGKDRVNVFVFCNPTNKLTDYFFEKDDKGAYILKSGVRNSTAWVNEACEETVATKDKVIAAATPNSFLMSNVRIAERRIPMHLNDWDNYKDWASAFDFSGMNNAGTSHQVNNSGSNGGGAVYVERVVARFDFKDGSPAATAANTYNVYKRNITTGTGNEAVTTEEPIIQIELQRMILTNMCNKFYYLPRTSSNGFEPSTLCGVETPANYMVGPYATEYNNFTSSNVNPNRYMNYPFFNEEIKNTDSNVVTEYSYLGENWIANYKISEVLAGADDNPEWTGTSKFGDYKVWRYVTENLIPADPENQVNGISTGVVFKGKMKATATLNENAKSDYDRYLYNALNGKNSTGETMTDITGNPDVDPVLYSYNNSLYCTWDAVLYEAYKASIIFDNAENTVPQYLNCTKNGEVIYDEVNGEQVPRKYLNVKRNEPLYKDVFGKGPIGSFKWNGIDYEDKYNEEGEVIPQDTKSPNYLWGQWRAASNNNKETARLTMANAMTKNGFTIYQSSNDTDFGPGYYCYYYYWNRHNDNNRSGEMGAMEFCVVRNNVYKLAVTSIDRLGHPREPVNDPNSPTPDTPDESDDIYFTVTCEVLPWVVRVNNITF